MQPRTSVCTNAEVLNVSISEFYDIYDAVRSWYFLVLVQNVADQAQLPTSLRVT